MLALAANVVIESSRKAFRTLFSVSMVLLPIGFAIGGGFLGNALSEWENEHTALGQILGLTVGVFISIMATEGEKMSKYSPRILSKIGFLLVVIGFFLPFIENSRKEIIENVNVIAAEERKYIRFFPDTASLLPGEQQKLNLIAENLRLYPDRDIVVSGHSAYAGASSKEELFLLSLDRARTVADYFFAENVIAKDRIVIRGYGVERPIAENDTEEGRHRNRRVEIILSEIVINEIIENVFFEKINGFGLARNLNNAFSLVLYGLFISAFIGIIMGALILSKIKFSISLDWLITIVCLCSGLIPFFLFINGFGSFYQSGIYMILIGLISSFALLLPASFSGKNNSSDIIEKNIHFDNVNDYSNDLVNQLNLQYKVTKTVNAMDNQDMASSYLFSLESQDIVSIVAIGKNISNKYNWIYVKTMDGKKGWCSSEFFEKLV